MYHTFLWKEKIGYCSKITFYFVSKIGRFSSGNCSACSYHQMAPTNFLSVNEAWMDTCMRCMTSCRHVSHDENLTHIEAWFSSHLGQCVACEKEGNHMLTIGGSTLQSSSVSDKMAATWIKVRKFYKLCRCLHDFVCVLERIGPVVPYWWW